MTRQSSNPFHYFALALAATNVLQFLSFNYRGILGWNGIGVYVTLLYGMVFVVSAIVWFVAQLRSKSALAIVFWVTMFLPTVFIALLPEKFSV